jgi:hypothetical protein
MPTITHFDIPADDVKRAKRFYQDLFGWKIEKLPGPMEYYQISTTNEKGEQGIGGGMAKRENPSDRITNYVDVPSVDKYLVKLKQLGGKILLPKTPIPGFGYLAVCLDTENNTFGLWETDKNAQ